MCEHNNLKYKTSIKIKNIKLIVFIANKFLKVFTRTKFRYKDKNKLTKIISRS